MLILASASPRRNELLRLITPDFTVDVSDADETLPDGLDAHEAVALLARRKAEAVAARRDQSDAVIGADTVVVLDGAILGKPHGREDAARMLRALAGRTHTVVTGVCVLAGGRSECFTAEARVAFAAMSEAEIAAYLDTGEPFDKAGAYGIQGFGARYIERVEGDYPAVVGLPVHPLYAALRRMGLLD